MRRIEAANDVARSHQRASLRRIVVALAGVLLPVVAAYLLWAPGKLVPLPGTSANGAWLTHAWWGDDSWFVGTKRRPQDYRGTSNTSALAARLHRLGISDWYVHACPATADGKLPKLLDEQAALLVEANQGGAVLAWVGGVLGQHCFPSQPQWRHSFAEACGTLVARTGIAGVQLNIEPCPSFEPGYLELLDDLRAALPDGTRLSIAAYPPPSKLHPFPEVHWSREFYRAVSTRSDDLCVMAYDTAIKLRKPYTWLLRRWTGQALAWSSCPVRIGLPAYEDAGIGYHYPEVENLDNALAGLAAALTADTPANYAGWAVYSEWTLDHDEEEMLRRYSAPATKQE